tara:strand:- start:119 stop:358 length:240 start_codon:yes stop_codon:yes gene_type:complete
MNRVKEHLKALNLKQNQFADYVGLKPMTFNNYISERRTPNVDIAWRVAVGIKKQYALNGQSCNFEDVFPPDSYQQDKAA